MKTQYKLILIFITALLLRFVNLDKNPTFISDEASIGYNAYSILNTGKDEWGNTYPLAFKSFGEYKLPVYVYSAVIPIKILGLNEVATRFPSAFFGSLTIVLVYFLVKELYKSKLIKEGSSLVNAEKIALLSALFLAISPWHVQMSRLALEANLALFLVVLGAYLLIKANSSVRFYVLAFAAFALSLYTYNTCRIFVPLFLVAYYILDRKRIILRKIFPGILVFILMMTPLLFNGFSGSRERLFKVGIFSDSGTINNINESRGECLKKLPQVVCTLRYNKATTYPLIYLQNYLSHFSFTYLFTNGSGLSQYQVPGLGSLYYFELPLLLVGGYLLFRQKHWFLFLWILIAPLANSLTGTAHPVRAIFMLPVFQIVSAIGLMGIYETIRLNEKYRKLFIVICAMIISSNISFFSNGYFKVYPTVMEWTWQGGYKGLYQYLAKNENNFNRIFITKYYGEPHIFYLFYSGYDPSIYQKNINIIRYNREDLWTNVDRIGKYYFVQEPKTVELSSGDILVTAPEEEILGKTTEMIKYTNGETAFVLQTK